MTLERTIRENLLDEAYNVAKLEQLVRLGLLPLKILPILKRALKRLQSGTMLNPEDRQALKMFVDKLIPMTLDDTATFTRLRTAVTQHRTTKMESHIHEDDRLKQTPEGMLDTITRNVKAKVASGGKISIVDKRMASAAKSELRRRRDVRKKAERRKHMKEGYEEIFNNVLKTYNVTSIASLSQQEAAEFFKKVEQLFYSGE